MVPRAGHLMCKPHWFSLPNRLRMKITVAYQNGGVRSAVYARAMSDLERYLKGNGHGPRSSEP